MKGALQFALYVVAAMFAFVMPISSRFADNSTHSFGISHAHADAGSDSGSDSGSNSGDDPNAGCYTVGSEGASCSADDGDDE